MNSTLNASIGNEYNQPDRTLQDIPVRKTQNGLIGAVFRARNTKQDGQGELLSGWSGWSRDSALVYDTKSQAKEVEKLDLETGEIQGFKVDYKGVKKSSRDSKEARDDRFSLQTTSRSVLGRDWRVSKCNRCMYHMDLPGGKKLPKNYAGVMRGEQGGAFFGGLVQCGSVWTCPVCGSKIAERRAKDMREAMVNAKSRGLYVSLVTQTVKHGVGDDISELLPKLAKAQTSFWGRRAVKDLFEQYGTVGRVRSLETTYGSAGWHPHVHLLIFSESPLPKKAQDVLARQWQRSCLSAGLPKPTIKNGLDIRNGEAAGEYVCKFADDSKLVKTAKGEDVTWDAADEMTKANAKKGRQGNITPFDMLRIIRDPETTENQKKFYRARFEEYARAFKGRRQLVWSRGLRDELGLGQDKTDEEIVNEMNNESNVIALLNSEEMSAVSRKELRSTVLSLSESGGITAIATLLHSLVDTKSSITDYIAHMSARLLRPEFGVKSVNCNSCGTHHVSRLESPVCPLCGHKNKKEDLDDGNDD